MKVNEGKCGVCNHLVGLTKEGELRVHTAAGYRCPGSHADPVPSILIRLEPVDG